MGGAGRAKRLAHGRKNGYKRAEVGAAPRLPVGGEIRHHAAGAVRSAFVLGCVDEFDQAEAGGEGNDRPEVPGCLFASEGDALEPLEPSDALLDAGAGFVEGACEEGRLVLFVGLVGDDRRDAARSRGVPIGLAGVAFVER